MTDLSTVSNLIPFWPIITSIVTLVATIWLTGKVHANKIARLEKDIEVLDKRYENTEKEMLSRLRGIEIQVTQLATMMQFLVKHSEIDIKGEQLDGR